jgi:catechol 2,3-dioxygenase-like lactoylglutathione lyase family enzyme
MEAGMSLSSYKVTPNIAVKDMQRAVEFYEGKLGLTVVDDDDAGAGSRGYQCGQGSTLFVFVSPEHAGESTATLAGWYVDDIERLVAELTAKGVVFEKYDEPPIVTDANGIATFEGGNKVAYFRDPDGNTLSLAQPGTPDTAHG